MLTPQMFSGPESLRARGERRSLWTSVLGAPVVIGLASLVFPGVSISEFILLIAAGLVIVSISRGKLLGSSIRVDGRQFPEIAELTHTIARRLGVATPQIFVRDDPFVPIVAVGIGEPYALVISSQYYEHLRRDELGFLIARELGHIAAGHTRLTSLLSASGRENPVVALVFGSWLRRTEYTADRIGLLCCDDLGDALGAIAITTFHAIGRRVDLQVLAEQREDLRSDPSLRVGEIIGATPYATNRLEALRTFATTPLAQAWRGRLDGGYANAQLALVAEQHLVAKDECASVVRRLCAACIDFAVIAAVLQAPVLVNVSGNLNDLGELGDDAVSSSHGHHRINTQIGKTIIANLPYIQFGSHTMLVFLAFFFYSAVLVGLGGQTLGMTVMDVRVVTTDNAKPGILQSFWRYMVALCSAMSTLAVVGFFMRIHPHDRLSKTRLVVGRKAA